MDKTGTWERGTVIRAAPGQQPLQLPPSTATLLMGPQGATLRVPITALIRSQKRSRMRNNNTTETRRTQP